MALKTKQTCGTVSVNGDHFSNASYLTALSLTDQARKNTQLLASAIAERAPAEIKRMNQHLNSKAVVDDPGMKHSYRLAKSLCASANKKAIHLLNLDVFEPRYHRTRKFLDNDVDTATSGLNEAARAYKIFKEYEDSFFSI